MGYLYKGVCYPTQIDARAAECSAMASITQATTNLYTTQCNSTTFTGSTFSLCVRTNGGACTVHTQPVQADIPCTFDPVTINEDMSELFYLGLGVFAGLLALRWIYNRFRPDRDDTP